MAPWLQVSGDERVITVQDRVPLDDCESLVQQRTENNPVGFIALRNLGGCYQLLEDRLHVASPNLPRVRGLGIKKLRPVESEKLVAFVLNAVLSPPFCGQVQ